MALKLIGRMNTLGTPNAAVMSAEGVMHYRGIISAARTANYNLGTDSALTVGIPNQALAMPQWGVLIGNQYLTMETMNGTGAGPYLNNFYVSAVRITDGAVTSQFPVFQGAAPTGGGTNGIAALINNTRGQVVNLGGGEYGFIYTAIALPAGSYEAAYYKGSVTDAGGIGAPLNYGDNFTLTGGNQQNNIFIQTRSRFNGSMISNKNYTLMRCNFARNDVGAGSEQAATLTYSPNFMYGLWQGGPAQLYDDGTYFYAFGYDTSLGNRLVISRIEKATNTKSNYTDAALVPLTLNSWHGAEISLAYKRLVFVAGDAPILRSISYASWPPANVAGSTITFDTGAPTIYGVWIYPPFVYVAKGVGGTYGNQLIKFLDTDMAGGNNPHLGFKTSCRFRS